MTNTSTSTSTNMFDCPFDLGYHRVYKAMQTSIAENTAIHMLKALLGSVGMIPLLTIPATCVNLHEHPPLKTLNHQETVLSASRTCPPGWTPALRLGCTGPGGDRPTPACKTPGARARSGRPASGASERTRSPGTPKLRPPSPLLTLPSPEALR
eukprot:CAMPEP_0114261000 /NCGR_PEP_ID=MMETSP0058-20121206/20852_1 /TAXON_ID=36894 /ORGANISM="Pyramimonas parkeae, CCMP726" /LENGTH=153 /DNA_ID=CAMNT_0001376403 /DNA_START=133 /DNA_END=594 /DNA_ORIENTATION=-